MYKILVTYKGYSGSAMQMIEFEDINQARKVAEKIAAMRDYQVTLLWS